MDLGPTLRTEPVDDSQGCRQDDHKQKCPTILANANVPAGMTY